MTRKYIYFLKRCTAIARFIWNATYPLGHSITISNVTKKINPPLKKQRLSCVTTSIGLAPLSQCHALKCILYIHSHLLHILHRTHSLSRPLLHRSISHTGSTALISSPRTHACWWGLERTAEGLGRWDDLTCRCFPVSTKTSLQVDNAHTNGSEVTGQEWEIALIS